MIARAGHKSTGNQEEHLGADSCSDPAEEEAEKQRRLTAELAAAPDGPEEAGPTASKGETKRKKGDALMGAGCWSALSCSR